MTRAWAARSRRRSASSGCRSTSSRRCCGTLGSATGQRARRPRTHDGAPRRADGSAGVGLDGLAAALRIHLPLFEARRDLYVSWNMAFTCTYGDSPYFASALLAPFVMGAQPEEFLFHRTLALHLHASSHFFTRCRLQLGPQSRHVMAARDWRDQRVTDQWGAINEVAAKGFERELARLKLRREAASAAEGERLRQLEQLRWAARPLLHPLSISELRRRLARPGRALIPAEDVRWAGSLLWAAPSALGRVITDRWEAADRRLYPRPSKRAAAKVSMRARE